MLLVFSQPQEFTLWPIANIPAPSSTLKNQENYPYRVAAFRSLIHEKQAARMKCRELESTARIHPSLYPDLVQMTSQLHEKGCARNTTHEADMSKFHGSTAAVSPFAANRASCVMPPAASSAMNSSNCGQGWKGKPHSREFP